MEKKRVVLYSNQFFAGMGGEDKAGLPPQLKEGRSGPGELLSRDLGGKGELVGWVFCGDDYINEKPEAVNQVTELIKSFSPDVVVAGSAFASGRYGLGCASVCLAVQEKLQIPTVTGMHPDNPGVDKCRSKVYIVPTGERATAMGKAMPVMAKLALKLAFGEILGSPEEEGYLPQGYRRNVFSDRTGAQRAIEMLLKRVRGESIVTERPLPKYEYVPLAPPVPDLTRATVALVTEGGCVPKGNPDRIEAAWATKWRKYFIGDLPGLASGDYMSVHGGYDTTYVNQDPNRLVPLDVARDLERDGVIGRLYEYFYTTVGNIGAISTISKFGKEIADDLKANNVNAVILTGT